MDPILVAQWSARAAGTSVGALLLYAAFFLYPDERRELHSVLESWWIRLDDARLHAIERQPVLIQRLAETTRRGFEWLFGAPFSVRFFVVSALLSMISFSLALTAVGDYGWAIPSGLLVFAVTTAWVVAQFGSDGAFREKLAREQLKYDEPLSIAPSDAFRGLTSPRLARAERLVHDLGLNFPPPHQPPAPENPAWLDEVTTQVPTYILALLVSSSTGLVLSGAIERGVGTGTFLFAILTAFTCDAISILVTMRMLDHLTHTRTTVRAAGWLLLDAAVAAAMFLIPFALFRYLFAGDALIGSFLVFVASANISTAIPSVVYVLLAAGLVLHRLLWPLLLRPFYNVVHAERMRHPKTLGSIGLALLVASWPEILTPFEPLVETLLDLV